MGSAGANFLPPGYTDQSAVRIPIKMSDIDGNEVQQQPPTKKQSFLRKLSTSGFIDKTKNEDVKVVIMTRGDYLKYWAKGEDGKFLPGVVEPPEGRREWVRKQIEFGEEWEKNKAGRGKKG